MTAREVLWPLFPQDVVPSDEGVQSLVERAAQMVTKDLEAANDLVAEDLVVGKADG